METPAAVDHESGFERDYTSRVSGAVSGAIFSIGDLFRDIRDGTKAVRFPKDLLKVLEQKLQDIAMGKDPAYVFSLLRIPLPSYRPIPAFLLLAADTQIVYYATTG